MKHIKNTYVFEINHNVAGRFERGLFNPAELAVVRKNGEHTYSQKNILTDGTVDASHMHNMIQCYDMLEPHMGIIAATAIEYLDKDTGNPVIILFPASAHICREYDHKTYSNHLNHAARRDLAYQIQLRNIMIERVNLQRE